MKKLLMLLFTASFIVACNNEPKIDYALVSGEIENPMGKTVVIRGHDMNQTINLNEDGTFADTLKIISNGYYSFSHGRENTAIYINMGDDFNITVTPKEFDETITYSGLGAESNNYLAAKYLYKEQNGVDVPTLFAKEESDFFKEAGKIKADSDAFLNKVEGLSEDFKALEAKSNHYDYLLNLQQYPGYHGYFAKKEDVKVSDEFNAPLKNITLDNDVDFSTFQAYKSIVSNHYREAYKNSDDLTSFFNEIKEIKSATIKDDLANKLVRSISPNNEKNEALFNGLNTISSDDKFKETLKTKYDKVKLLAKGMPSPVFANYENHKGGETSLADLRGKYVYVDVWATWCGPCKREIPFLKEVEGKYHGKNIEFVSTSIDRAKDHDAWVEMVKDKELGGVQLMADKDWKSEFVRNYDINGIPRFILIDPDGNIVSADAPRPSDPKLIDLFNDLKI